MMSRLWRFFVVAISERDLSGGALLFCNGGTAGIAEIPAKAANCSFSCVAQGDFRHPEPAPYVRLAGTPV